MQGSDSNSGPLEHVFTRVLVPSVQFVGAKQLDHSAHALQTGVVTEKTRIF